MSTVPMTSFRTTKLRLESSPNGRSRAAPSGTWPCCSTLKPPTCLEQVDSFRKRCALSTAPGIFSRLLALGRDFSPSDDDPAAAGAVVVSWGLWQRRFAGNPSLIGRTIRLDAKTYTVIGIMPPWFAYPDPAAQLWLPVYHEESPKDMQVIDSHDFLAIGRLAPGIGETEATAELALIVRRIHDQHLDNP